MMEALPALCWHLGHTLREYKKGEYPFKTSKCIRDSDYLQKMNLAELSEYQKFKSNEMPYRFNENCSVRPITLGLRVRILMPLKFAAIKRKQTLDSVCFYSGGRI